MTHTNRRSPVRALIVAAAAVALLAVAPAGAQAQNTLELSIEPAIPKKGKAFEVLVQGTANGGGSTSVYWGFGSGTAPCATTAALEGENRNGAQTFAIALTDGPFELRRVYDRFGDWTVDPRARFNAANGVVTGHYRACGYLYDAGDRRDRPTQATRLEFTVGGTCASSTKGVARAQAKLKKAQSALRKARSRRNAKAIRRAGSQVKKAKAALKRAQADRKALC